MGKCEWCHGIVCSLLGLNSKLADIWIASRIRPHAISVDWYVQRETRAQYKHPGQTNVHSQFVAIANKYNKCSAESCSPRPTRFILQFECWFVEYMISVFVYMAVHSPVIYSHRWLAHIRDICVYIIIIRKIVPAMHENQTSHCAESLHGTSLADYNWQTGTMANQKLISAHCSAVGCERMRACVCDRDRWMQQFRDVFTHALIDRLIKIEIEKCIAPARVFVWGNNKGNHFPEHSRLVHRGVAFWFNFGHKLCALGFVFRFFGSEFRFIHKFQLFSNFSNIEFNGTNAQAWAHSTVLRPRSPNWVGLPTSWIKHTLSAYSWLHPHICKVKLL